MNKIGDNELDEILSTLQEIEHIEIIRIGTRAIVVNPMRITDDLINIFKKYKPLWINTHFNHPKEITADAVKACTKIVDRPSDDVTQNMLVTIYKTDVETTELLEKFGITVSKDKIIDGTTLLLEPGQMQTLYRRAPYLISMSVTDLTQVKLEDIVDDEEIDFDSERKIPVPGNEPIVGVIDTQFNEKVYFHEWVEYKNMLSNDIQLEKKDYYHGTAVTSIIVDGPKGNPKLDDGCGRFRVRHFGVATQSGFSSFAILRSIREIVANNPDIKVWNLSLGSPEPIKDNFISPEAAELDRIQSEYDVIFIVAGTNTPDGLVHPEMKVGSPADSLNAMVVNSVTMENESASYSRRGPVLSFFHKPDVSYYGGDGNRQDTKIALCIDNMGAIYKAGTSFAAPWITRKMAYLIHVMGLTREVAKALLIDSAAKWSANGRISDSIGYGVVPKRIEDVLSTSDDEIKFFITGTTEDYETYNYNLPVLVVDGKHTRNEQYKALALSVSDNMDGKVYAVVKKELDELMKLSNEYFDVRHNDYLNAAKEKREPLNDSQFIEYLYNRAYSILYLLRLKS